MKICDVVTRSDVRLAVAGIMRFFKKIGRDVTIGITSGRVKSAKSGKI